MKSFNDKLIRFKQAYIIDEVKKELEGDKKISYHKYIPQTEFSIGEIEFFLKKKGIHKQVLSHNLRYV